MRPAPCWWRPGWVLRNRRPTVVRSLIAPRSTHWFQFREWDQSGMPGSSRRKPSKSLSCHSGRPSRRSWYHPDERLPPTRWRISLLAHSLTSQLILLSSINRTWRSLTTSSPSTPEHLNPLVQVANRALVNPSWLQGKLKVKPRGNGDTSTICSCIKVAKHSAMWSNNCRRKEINIVNYWMNFNFDLMYPGSRTKHDTLGNGKDFRLLHWHKRNNWTWRNQSKFIDGMWTNHVKDVRPQIDEQNTKVGSA